MSIHKLLKPQEIVKLYTNWNSAYTENNRLGNTVADFISGDQWDYTVRNNRINAGKEVLTLNMAIKHLHRLMVDYMSVDYTLKATPRVIKEPEHINNVNELLDQFVLENNKDETTTAEERLLTHGYTVFKVIPEYYNRSSYQLIPYIKHVAKPEKVFFDLDATWDTKADGRYCGEESLVYEDELRELFPKYKGDRFSTRDHVFSDKNKVRVYDFYYKQKKKVKFYKVRDTFKPEYQLTEYEKLHLGNTEYFEKMMPFVYACKCTEDEFLVTPREYYGIESLPYIFVGSPIFVREQDTEIYKQKIIPYLFPLIDPQQMLNNAASQIATQTTKKIERSVIMDKSAIDQEDVSTWENFNVNSGTFPWKSTTESGGKIAPPVVLEPPTLDTSLIQLMQIAKMMIDEVMGVNLSQQGAGEDKAQSGVALAQRIAHGDTVQKRFLFIFIKALNQAGVVVKEMLAALVKDEFEFMLNDRIVKINQLAPSSLPNDPVKQTSFEKLHEEYDFTIEASPSSQLEKMRSRETYLTIARLLPQYTPYFIDILFENLDVNNSTELIKRFQTMVDPDLVAVGKGEITKEEYYQRMQQRAAQQQQQPDPAMAMIKVESQKNQTQAQLKNKELDQNFVIENNKLIAQQAKLLASEQNEETKAAVKLLDTQAKNLKKYINGRG